MTRPFIPFWAALACGLVAAGCGGGSARSDAGHDLYERRCRSCHEADGSAPELTTALLRSYRSAQALFDYVQMAMPEDAPGELSDEEYWDVVGYLVESRGIMDW